MSTEAVEFLHSLTANKQVTPVDLCEIGRPAKDLAATSPQTGASLHSKQADSVASVAIFLGDEVWRQQMIQRPFFISSKVFLIT